MSETSKGLWRDGSMWRQPRSIWIFLISIFLVSVATHTFFALSYETIPLPDGSSRLADAALDGAFKSYHPPIYILFLKMVFLIFGKSNITAVAIIQGILTSLAVFPLFFTGYVLGGRPAGIVASAAGGLYVQFILYGMKTFPDAAGLLLAACLFTMLTAMRPSRSKAVRVAAMLALAVHTSPLLLYLAPGIFATIRKRLIFLVVLAGLLAPWTIRNSIVAGRPVLLYRSAAVALDTDKLFYDESKWESVDALYESAERVFSKGWTGDIVGIDPYRQNMRYSAAYSFTFLLLGGLTGLLTRMRRDYLIPVVSTTGYLVLLVVLSESDIRCRYPLEILLLPAAGQLVGSWWSFMYERTAKSFAGSDGRSAGFGGRIVSSLRRIPAGLAVYLRSIPGRLRDPE